jgi:hypothetical protein
MTPEQADADDAENADLSLRGEAMSEPDADEDVDQVDDDLIKMHNDSLNPRLSRISVSHVFVPRLMIDRVYHLASHFA